MFHPEEIIFAPTGRCNLRCPHCRVARGTGELSAAESIAFLDACAEGGIERIGFSGGEPFLRVDFLAELSRAAVERGLFFDRLMTNGDWWASEADARASLETIFEAGFDGIVGLSYDAYHGQSPERIASFLRAVFDVWGRKDAAEILSVRSPDDGAYFQGLEEVAISLGGRLESDYGEPYRVVDAAFLSRSGSDPDDGSGLLVPIIRSPRSRSAQEGAWDDPRWFVDDYCAGPGNVLYVHPDGSVAACCGFANENPALKIGTIADSFGALMRNAAERPQLVACYETGLGEVRKRLEAAGARFPGKTGDMCFFCDYLCGRGLE